MIMHYAAADATYWLESSYAEKDAAKAAGFRWEPNKRVWWTTDSKRAARLTTYADAECKAVLERVAADVERTVAASQATSADISLPCPEGLAYMPFQRAGIAYGMQRPNVLIGDEMGLGKTIQAIGILNAMPDCKYVLIVCPASLKLNWKRESTKWLTHKLTIGICESTYWPDTDVVIINYDLLKKHREALHALTWDAMIIDECHYAKNSKAQRTAEIWGKGRPGTKDRVEPIPAKRRIALSGTPLVNRPSELWTLVHALDPKGLGSNWMRYHERYCDLQQTKWGYDTSGASNLDELQRRLRETIMVRRLKADVLKELPAKRRQIIALPNSTCRQVIDTETRIQAANDEALLELRAAVEIAKASDTGYEEAVAALRQAQQIAFTEIARVRHETALAKAPIMVEAVRDVLETEDKVVVFAHHLDVIEVLRAGLEEYGVAVLTGECSQADRQASVDIFQTDPRCRVFIGGIKAAGVGLTLTAASHVMFAELDYVPGVLSQCEDRCHRIGQTDSVLIQHYVLEDSIDCRMAEVLVEKQAVLDRVLDGGGAEAQQIIIVPPANDNRAATYDAKREALEAEGQTITEDQRTAILQALQYLAAFDTDHARMINGVGYSKIDGKIGHSLATCARLSNKQAALGRRLVNKYRRQLGTEVLETCGIQPKEKE